jgi:hypothetical protein
MKKEVTIEVPKNWSAITLKEYLDLQHDLEAYGDNDNAVTAALLHHLCKMNVQWIKQLDVDTFIKIKSDLSKFLNKTEHDLQRFITIDGIEYGFEPNLSQMSYGAYVDISAYEELGINKNWANIMSILYRPVTKRVGKLYDIESYAGNLEPEKFMNVTMDVHFGALFFFKDLHKDLLNYILKSLKDHPEISPSMSSILEKSGNLILP